MKYMFSLDPTIEDDSKLLYLEEVEHIAAKIIRFGNKTVDKAINMLGVVISQNNCKDTIIACEKMIEVLNEGPQIRSINKLSKEQSRYSVAIMTAIYDCLTLTV